MTHNFASNSRTPAFAAIFIAVVLIVCALASADQIRLHDQAATESSQVLLSDIAELQGASAESLGAIVVADFGDKHRGPYRIKLEDLRRQLTQQHQVNWARLSLTGYLECEVVRLQAQPARRMQIADQATPVISNHIQPVTTQTSLTVRDRIIAQLGALADVSRDELEITFPSGDEAQLNQAAWADRWEVQPTTSSTLGRIPLVIRRYNTDDEIVQTIRATADVSHRRNILVIAKKVRRGQLLGPSDVKTQQVNWTQSQNTPLTQAEQAVGLMVSRNLDKGAPLLDRDVQAPVVVKRGENITVRAISGGFVVRMVGRATESGAMGEVIRIQNPVSRKYFHVRITGRSEGVVISDRVALIKDES